MALRRAFAYDPETNVHEPYEPSEPSHDREDPPRGSTALETREDAGRESIRDPDLRAPQLYLNRELSWLEFNARVLSEAENEAVPPLERLKFFGIFASNLDEFFMVRVAGLQQKRTGDVGDVSADGLSVAEQIAAISSRVHELVGRQYRSLYNDLLPRLMEHGVYILKPEQLAPEFSQALDAKFRTDIFPILTPIAIDMGHPFPHVRNKSLNLGVMLSRVEGAVEPGFGVVQVPMMLPRLLEVLDAKLLDGRVVPRAYVLLEDLVARNAGLIFPGFRIKGVYTFRVTRNFDLEIDEEEAEDLLQTIQQELRRRDRGNAVRLEVSGDPSPSSLSKLAESLKVDPEKDLYHVQGILNVTDLMQLLGKEEKRELRDEPFAPLMMPALRDADDLFSLLREQDVLLHHPYDSFETVVDFMNRAADDPDVLAIKQTLYRAGGDSPIVKALARAAESGKQVTAVVELKARFDEESNIQWARTLEQSGAHVVYGLLGLKTHAKCLLVVRREAGGLRRYVHFSTGNYNSSTAKLYTDVSLFSSRANLCEDASSFFNLLTGYSAPPKWNSLVVAPLGMHEAVLGLINRESEHARAGRPAKIVAKMNALVDEEVIEALYRASQAGVNITLLIRGVCCLRPGVPGVSDNIVVRAVVDRFLEHARIFQYANGGKEEMFISSADWMPRNFHRRVEIMLPIEDAGIRMKLTEIMQTQAADTVKAWSLRSDGVYTRVQANLFHLRSQMRFMEITKERVKAAEASTRTSHRFHFAPTQEETTARRRKRREGKKG